jgi:hypothetical protein
MSISHTINVNDLTNQDAVLRVLQDMQAHGVSYALIQNGEEVAKFVPTVAKKYNDGKVSDGVTKRRWEVEARMDALSKKIAEEWSTDETAVEAITNDRNASDRRLFHGSR